MSDVPAIEARDLQYSVGGRKILDGVSMSVRRGESAAVTGPSGTGKTTLLMCLAGILQADSGTVTVDGTDFGGLRAADRAAVRLRQIGLIYQFGELLPELTPLENAALPALLQGVPQRQAHDKARGLLADLGVDGVAGSSTANLSGGERQRVAVARALICDPVVVLADEPTGSLDAHGTTVVGDLLFPLPQRYGCALVVVTHNDAVAARADRIVSFRAEGGRLAVSRS